MQKHQSQGIMVHAGTCTSFCVPRERQEAVEDEAGPDNWGPIMLTQMRKCLWTQWSVKSINDFY